MAIDLIIVRHGVAKDSIKWAEKGLKESDRPLTELGRQRIALEALGLSLFCGKVERILTSPFTRCLQTAKILAERLDPLKSPMSLKALAVGGSTEKTLLELARFERGVVIVVGHEPELSELIDRLLSPNFKRNWTQLKKGGAVRIAFTSTILPDQGKLNWYLKPKALRELGKSFASSLPQGKKSELVPMKVVGVA